MIHFCFHVICVVLNILSVMAHLLKQADETLWYRTIIRAMMVFIVASFSVWHSSDCIPTQKKAKKLLVSTWYRRFFSAAIKNSTNDWRWIVDVFGRVLWSQHSASGLTKRPRSAWALSLLKIKNSDQYSLFVRGFITCWSVLMHSHHVSDSYRKSNRGAALQWDRLPLQLNGNEGNVCFCGCKSQKKNNEESVFCVSQKKTTTQGNGWSGTFCRLSILRKSLVETVEESLEYQSMWSQLTL